MNKVKEKHISKLKLLSFYLIMIGLTIVVCFALLEFGLARYYQSTENRISITTFDPTLGWRLRPGSYSVKPSYTFKHHPQKKYSSTFVPRPTSRFYTVEVVNSRLKILLQTMPRFVNVLRRFGIQPKLPRMPSLIYGWYVDETSEPGVPLMKALIKEIREEAYRNNAVLLVSVIPSPFQVYPDVYDHMLRGTYAGNKAVAS